MTPQGYEPAGAGSALCVSWSARTEHLSRGDAPNQPAFTVGTPAAKVYAELVSKPGLFAFVTADRATRYFLGVTFRHSRP
jgi:hypothetical protein